MKEVLLATRNIKKLLELKRLMRGFGVRVLGLDKFSGLGEVKEDRSTLRGNAVKKSTQISRVVARLVLSDDSGLEVPALGFAPGVRSARYAGLAQDDDKNIAKLLKKMKDFRPSQRRARFRCFICISVQGKAIKVVSGTVTGRIALERAGVNGFGYDSVFVPTGSNKTFAQIGSRQKDMVSHRAIALKKARTVILEYFRKYR
ncbi:MAG: RdgB/HAM1 family non-canonical purine NTP pyrophosphatase [Candidatus Omnitrophota bacterium]